MFSFIRRSEMFARACLETVRHRPTPRRRRQSRAWRFRVRQRPVREPPDRTGPFEATEKRLPLFAHDRDDFLRGEAALIEAGAGASERSNRRDAHDALRRKNSGMSNPSLGGETAASRAFSSSISLRSAGFSRRRRGFSVLSFSSLPTKGFAFAARCGAVLVSCSASSGSWSV